MLWNCAEIDESKLQDYVRAKGELEKPDSRATEVLLGLVRLSKEDNLMLKGGMAECLIANRRDGLSVKIVLKIGLLGFACYLRVK